MKTLETCEECGGAVRVGLLPARILCDRCDEEIRRVEESDAAQCSQRVRGETRMTELRETYRETRALLSEAYLDFNSLPNASNYRRLYDAMNAHQEAFQKVLDEQERLNR